MMAVRWSARFVAALRPFVLLPVGIRSVAPRSCLPLLVSDLTRIVFAVAVRTAMR